jgi:hypothetical protein
LREWAAGGTSGPSDGAGKKMKSRSHFFTTVNLINPNGVNRSRKVYNWARKKIILKAKPNIIKNFNKTSL